MRAFTEADFGLLRKPSTYTLTAGGWARSGKGTSMGKLKDRLELMGQSVRYFDQGIKFRVIGEHALVSGQSLDSPAELEHFIGTRRVKQATLANLEEAYALSEEARKARYYTPQVTTASRKVATVPSSHEIALGLLRTEVETAVDEAANVVLIDGRMMEKYAKQYEKDGLARFAMGWYFKCDPVKAARRTLGKFGDLDKMSSEDRDALLAEADSISNRNMSDMLRDARLDPLKEPSTAYTLDLLSYGAPDTDTPYGVSSDILNLGSMAVVDTSYTTSIEQMTTAITDVSIFALMHRGLMRYEAASSGVYQLQN